MSNIYEVDFKHGKVIVLTLTPFFNWMSAKDSINAQQVNGLVFDTADIFEGQGKSRYLVNTENFRE